ncbi:hypothetical protein BDV93DRAFT_560899 [Ceratobasidium sp. AG-I]|nr:hypothetical protein BDV93DRAFT_560899 [Ceratobasidium sp. AG-I]
MRLTSVVSAAALLLGATLANAASTKPKSLPSYKHIYSFSLELTENHLVNGPLGTRVGLGLTGGNMTAPNGTVIGKVVPGVGGETGIIDKNGNLELDVKVFFQFVDDKKFAYVAVSGIGPLSGHPLDAHHVETDSPSRLAWNSYYIIANVSLATPSLVIGDAFAFSTS